MGEWRRDKRVEGEVGKGPKAFSIAHTGFRLDSLCNSRFRLIPVLPLQPSPIGILVRTSRDVEKRETKSRNHAVGSNLR